MSELREKVNYQNNFVCNEETRFYSYCVEDFILINNYENKEIVEFGTGDGTAIIKAVISSNYKGRINGYEINNQSINIAKNSIIENDIANIYKIKNQDFFTENFNKESILISNPPYLAAYTSDLIMPGLYGGLNGNELSKKLIDLDFSKVLILLASYCDPKGFIKHCLDKGYIVSDFAARFMEFGYYTSEDKVMQRINDMKFENRAFFNNKGYILSGVFLEKKSLKDDLSDELISVLTTGVIK